MTIRDRAKALGARWDGGSEMWAMPTPEAHAEVTAAVTAFHDAEQTAKATTRAAAKAVAAEIAQEDSATAAARAIVKSGRTPAGEDGRFGEHSTQRYNRASAEAAARHLGSVVSLSKGRAVITGVRVWFTGEEMASSICWHADTHDEAHWDWSYTVTYVEPTAAEVAADEEALARAADEAEIGAVFAEAQKADRTEAGQREEWSPVTGPSISRRGGSSLGGFSDGRLILDGERVVWQHPGWYDAETATTDTTLVARMRALIERGTRTVGAYTVKVDV